MELLLTNKTINQGITSKGKQGVKPIKAPKKHATLNKFKHRQLDKNQSAQILQMCRGT
jgi:hypothetical protein